MRLKAGKPIFRREADYISRTEETCMSQSSEFRAACRDHGRLWSAALASAGVAKKQRKQAAMAKRRSKAMAAMVAADSGRAAHLRSIVSGP
jgi:hypothetical protein